MGSKLCPCQCLHAHCIMFFNSFQPQNISICLAIFLFSIVLSVVHFLIHVSPVERNAPRLGKLLVPKFAEPSRFVGPPPGMGSCMSIIIYFLPEADVVPVYPWLSWERLCVSICNRRDINFRSELIHLLMGRCEPVEMLRFPMSIYFSAEN